MDKELRLSWQMEKAHPCPRKDLHLSRLSFLCGRRVSVAVSLWICVWVCEAMQVPATPGWWGGRKEKDNLCVFVLVHHLSQASMGKMFVFVCVCLCLPLFSSLTYYANAPACGTRHKVRRAKTQSSNKKQGEWSSERTIYHGTRALFYHGHSYLGAEEAHIDTHMHTEWNSHTYTFDRCIPK